VINGGKGTATLTMEADDIDSYRDSLQAVIDCFRASGQTVPCDGGHGFEPPEMVNGGQIESSYYFDAQGQRVDGSPVPSDPKMDVEMEDFESIECDYYSYSGFNTVHHLEWGGVPVPNEHINTIILVLYLCAGGEIHNR
jgi:hypothetical protein